MQAVVLICDGCQTEIGNGGEYRSAMDARAAAYAAGWRFPPKVKANGTASAVTSDVCPDCEPGWQPPTRPNTHKRKNTQYRPVHET